MRGSPRLQKRRHFCSSAAPRNEKFRPHNGAERVPTGYLRHITLEPSRNPNLRKIPSQKIEERIWVGGRAIFFGFLGEGVEGVTQIPKKLLYFLYGHENVYKNPNVRGFPRNPKIVFTGFPQTLYFDLEPTQKTQVWVSGRLHFRRTTSTNVSQPKSFATVTIMSGNKIFDVAICTIFAREFLEGAIIIGQYR